jgi:hypothetical protein
MFPRSWKNDLRETKIRKTPFQDSEDESQLHVGKCAIAHFDFAE